MDDPLPVGGVQRIRHLDGDVQERLHAHGPAVDPPLQGPPLQQLHRDEGPTLEVADVVHGADARVIQSGGGAGLARETLDRLRIPHEVVGKELEGDLAAEPRVLRPVHDAHAAPAQPADDPIACALDGVRRRHRLGVSERGGHRQPVPALHSRRSRRPASRAVVHDDILLQSSFVPALHGSWESP